MVVTGEKVGPPIEEDLFAPKAEPAPRVGEERPQENISEFVQNLRANGIRVSLIDAAGWGTAAREQVRRWLPTIDMARVPEVLAVLASKNPKVLDDKLWPDGFRQNPLVQTATPKKDETVDEQVARIEKRHAEEREKSAPANANLVQAGLSLEVSPGKALKKLVDDVAAYPSMTPEEREAQRRDFAYGNTKLANPAITREMVDKAAVTIDKEKAKPALRTELPEAWGGPPEHPPVAQVASESPEYDQLIETVLREMNLEHEYGELEQVLEIGAERRDYTTVNEHVDKGGLRAWRAQKLAAQAEVEYERLKLDQKEVDADLWRQATEALEKQDAKTRIADVEAQIMKMFPDEWRGGKLRLKRAEVTRDLMLGFAKTWSQRVESLKAMLVSVRK